MSSDAEQVELIHTALAGLRFGEIVIAVHDGDIVQLAHRKLRPRTTSDRT